MIDVAGRDPAAHEDLVAASDPSVLLGCFLWSCASFLPICMGRGILLLWNNAVHRGNLRGMFAHNFPVNRISLCC
jgi:hypothetical protein